MAVYNGQFKQRHSPPQKPTRDKTKSLNSQRFDVNMGPDSGAHVHERKSSFAQTRHNTKRPSTLATPAAPPNDSSQGGACIPCLKALSEPSEALAKGGPNGPDEQADAMFGAGAPNRLSLCRKTGDARTARQQTNQSSPNLIP